VDQRGGLQKEGEGKKKGHVKKKREPSKGETDNRGDLVGATPERGKVEEKGIASGDREKIPEAQGGRFS